MKNVISAVAILFVLTGCSIQDIDKAQQEVACSEYGGVYRYAPPTIKVRCNSGDFVGWRGITGHEVVEALKEIQGEE